MVNPLIIGLVLIVIGMILIKVLTKNRGGDDRSMFKKVIDACCSK